MSPLSWQSLVFLIPTGIGALLAIGAAFAIHDDGAGGAGHPEAVEGQAVAAGHHHAPDGGRMPLTIRLMVASLAFGGIGRSLSYVIGSSPLRTALAALVALVATAWISTRLTRLFTQRLPLLETETVGRRELLGSTGRAVLPVGPAGGLVQVHDRRGNLHQLPCRTLEGEPALAAGTEVLLVDYDEPRAIYRATANPLPPGPRGF
jgi:hypothetical protein